MNQKKPFHFLRKAIADYSLTSKAYRNLRTIVYGIFKYAYEIREYSKTEASIKTVFVPTEFSRILRRLKLMSGNSEYIFWKDNKNLKVLQVRKRLYQLCDRINIKRKSPHKLRKTYVSILLDNGIDKRLVQDIDGHTQISTSEKKLS